MKNVYKVRTLIENVLFPEGPAFQSDGTLWAVELHGQGLIESRDKEVFRHQVGGGPNGIAIDKTGDIWFCDSSNNAIKRFAISDGIIWNEITILPDGRMVDKPNDLAFDCFGNLIFSCPGNSRKNPTGYVCCYNKLTNETRVIADGLYFPNGIAFTPDGKYLIVAETYRHKLWKGRWDAHGCEWISPVEWCHIGGPDGPGGPDGMAFDIDGNLYVAIYGTGMLKVVDKQGVIETEIPLPGLNPTNCAFDPTGTLGLIVCEAQHSQILSVDIDVVGAPLFA